MRTKFANDEYYHVYNRGVEKRKIFLNVSDYERFMLALELMNDEQDGLMILWRDYKESKPNAQIKDFLRLNLREKRKKLVEIICYCLNQNHYHLILKQISERGVERFMQRLGTGHTMYFNKKNKRSGVLFQGGFKSSHIDSNEYLLYLSAYVNGNNFIHGYRKDFNWPYSSVGEYIGKNKKNLCRKSVILEQFKDIREYEKFCRTNIFYLRDKKETEKYLLES